MGRYSKLYRAGYRITTDPQGSVRRLQALHVMGHPRRVIAEMTGLSYNYLYELSRGNEVRVATATAVKIAAVYDELHMVRRADTTGKRVTAHAVKHGYVPPMGWDCIDSDAWPHVRVRAA